jgi:SAM-dependent methyltransferase
MDLTEINPDFLCRHPWELSRAESILSFAKNLPAAYKYADIGCGDAFFTSFVSGISDYPVYALDPFLDKTGPADKIVKCKDINELPVNYFDIIFMLDVLEHVEADRDLLDRAHKCLNRTGKLVITVPAFQFLFSGHDRLLKHFRRYSLRSFLKIVDKDKFSVNESFYFYFSLFIVRLLQRNNNFGGISRWKYPCRHFFTLFVKKILSLDFKLCRKLHALNVCIPGLSLCLVLAKKHID